MRLRDYKFHILICIIVLTLVCLFTYFYFQSYKDKIEETSLRNSIVDCESSLIELNNNILEAKNSFLRNDIDSNVSEVTNLVSSYKSLFINESQTCIVPENKMEKSNSEIYYLYILETTSSRVGKVSLGDIIPTEPEEGYSVLYVASDGLVAYSENINTPFYSFLLNEGNDDLTSIKDNSSKGANFSRVININNTKYLLSGITIGTSLYYARIIPATEYQESLATITNLTIVFVITIVLALATVIFTLLHAFKQNSKFIQISRKSASRSDSIIIRAKHDGKIFYCNHRIKKLTEDMSKITNVKDFVVDDGRRMEDCLKLEEKMVVVFKPKGENMYIEFTPFRYNHTFYLIGSDITLDYEERKNLEILSSKNPITKLPNYYQMVSEFPKVKDKCSNLSMQFLMINIFEYQELLKLFGQDVVNQIVLEASKRITDSLEDYYLYHVNDSTFLIYLYNTVKEQNVKSTEKVMKALRATYNIKTNNLYVKYKFSTLEASPAQVALLQIEETYRKLDITLERCKKLVNRDILKYDATIENYVSHRKQMQEDILIALEKEEFEMYYQPQYDVLEDRIAGFEALIRWNNPKYINVSPQEYIELSEQNGYIIDIGNFIIRSVFKKAKEFEQFDVHISVNVSPAQLFQAGFTSFLLDEFEKNKLKPGSIAVEITETFLMENLNVVMEKLNLLRSKGFSIHLDDFGTGYSSLQYLKDLPVDTIKTDKDFIKNIVSDNYTKNIIKGIISMAKAVDLKVISEGVETKEQAEILKKLGTDYFQGYIISKAIPFEEALNMVKNGVDIYKKTKKAR